MTGGHSDWRLPTKKELESLVETGCANPAINTTLFPNTPSSWNWNSTPLNAAYPANAWFVAFDYGNDSVVVKTHDAVVRLVRGGQSVDTFDRHADFTPAAFSFTAATDVATSSITQATVYGGATLIIPTTLAPGGVTLTLPLPASGSAAPVTLSLNGQSLSVTPGSANTVLNVSAATVTVNGVATTTQVLSVTSGSVSVSASGGGQPLLAVGRGNTTHVLTSGSAGAATVSASADASSGHIIVVVTSGMVALPPRSTAANRRALTATQNYAYAGETVLFDSAGQLQTHRAGSADGRGGAGDPLSVAYIPATLTLNATVPNLKGSLARLNGQTPEQAALGLLGPNFTLENGGQNATGVLPLRFGDRLVPVLPLGPLNIDGSLTADGLYQFVRSGLVMQFAPSVRDSRQLASDLARLQRRRHGTAQRRRDRRQRGGRGIRPTSGPHRRNRHRQ